MIKVPMVPLQPGWPDAHTERHRPAGSVDLAGVLLKMGAYACCASRCRCSRTPPSSLSGIVALAVVGIIHGAWLALPQTDMKRLVAYSSVSHLGFVMLGLYASTTGMTAACCRCSTMGSPRGAVHPVGYVYERRHTRLIAEYGGIWWHHAGVRGAVLVVTLSSIGSAGDERLRRRVPHPARRLPPPIPGRRAFATLGVVLGAVYMLTM